MSEWSMRKRVLPIGKTPGCYQCTFGDGFLLYKEDVLENGECVFKGLYCKYFYKPEEEASVLLSDNFYASANIYMDKIIFIDCDFNISMVDLTGKVKECLVDNGGKCISDALVIGDILYYLAETDEDASNENALFALDLKTKKTKLIMNHVNYRYLYHYNGMAGVISRKDGKFYACNMEEGVVQKFDGPDNEIIGFLSDGTVISYENDIIYMGEGVQDKTPKKLLEQKNIYRLIMHPDEMLVCTIDDYGLIEIFIYDFGKEKLNKIANANSVPREFNKRYVMCQSEQEGVGGVELIDRESGDMISLYSVEKRNDQTQEIDSGEKLRTTIEDFFRVFLNKLLENGGKDYESKDFSTINGYIAAKNLVAVRESHEKILEKICEVNVEDIVIEDVEEADNELQVKVCVKYNYSWGTRNPEDTCNVSAIYRICLEKQVNRYKVIDLDEVDNVEIRSAKNFIKNVKDIDTQIRMIDEYFERMK